MKPSIHKALASLDCGRNTAVGTAGPFDPQGSREPRPEGEHRWKRTETSIHKALASLDGAETVPLAYASDFDPQGSREPRRAMYTTLSMLFRLRSTRLSRASTDGILVSSRPIVFDPQGSREPRRQKCTIILASMPHLHASYYTSSTNRLSS